MLAIKSLNSKDIQVNDLSEIDNKTLKSIKGGRLPNDNELAIILALRNTHPSRSLTGAVLDNKSIAINIAIFGPGSGGNIGQQING